MFLNFYNIEITNQMIIFYTIVDQITDLFLCKTSIVASKIVASKIRHLIIYIGVK